jgi:glycine dehydrogenase subunit 1
MLKAVGLTSLEELFQVIPESLRNPKINLGPPLSERELIATFSELAGRGRNRPLTQYHSFLGAGVYHRFIPAIVKATIARPEFYTSYTPYQAEASQGMLQTIFEFQSCISALTGLPVANASLYDGSSAAAEAMLMATAETGRTRVVISQSLHPDTKSVVRTYAKGKGLTVVESDRVADELDDQTAAVLVAQPDFLGYVHNWSQLVALSHSAGALVIACVDPIACTVLKSPGELGFDIAVGDCQPLGLPPSFGGPHAGFLAASEKLVRRMPGRLVGMTTDTKGERAYTLTLQTREQHIRRENATSNICTNHALMALAATVYMAYMGETGMKNVAQHSAETAHDLATRLREIPGVSAVDDTPYLWEFVLQLPISARAFAAAMRKHGVLAGFPLGSFESARDQQILVCCTEITSQTSLNKYVQVASEVLAEAKVAA